MSLKNCVHEAARDEAMIHCEHAGYKPLTPRARPLDLVAVQVDRRGRN